MAHTSPTIPMAVSLPPETSSDLLWVGLGGSQNSKVTPTHHVLDSRDEAKDSRAVISFLDVGIPPSQCIRSNWFQI